MSMHNYACHAYTVEANQLTKLLPPAVQNEYTDLLYRGDWEGAQDLLKDHFPRQYSLPWLFVMDDEFESQDLEVGLIYAAWNLDDLYTVIPKSGLAYLRREGVSPQSTSWVAFG